MWRGWHKLVGGEEAFDKLANLPSTFPDFSSEGKIPICDRDGVSLFAIVVDGAFPLSYYDFIVGAAQSKGFEPALLNQGSGQQEKGISMKSIRSSDRCIMDDVILANKLWTIVEQYLPHRDVVPGKRYKGWKATGINPRFRVLKYSAGQRFEMHQDGSYHIDGENENSKQQQSFMTLQLYLNDGGGVEFVGGATRFIEPLDENTVSLSTCLSGSTAGDSASGDGCTSTHSSPGSGSGQGAKVYDVVPKAGRLLIFQHNCWHEGEMVTSGEKYVLRSEIMYSKE